jgi:hypothetical protein
VRHIHFLFFFISLIISQSVFSFNSGRLNSYMCPSAADAKSCSNKCEKFDGQQVTIKVNVNNSVVILNMFNDKKLFHTVSLENCKVADEKNWICERFSELIQQSHTNSMTNGIFSNFDSYSSGGMCAK